jgi:hypothetical protein
MLQDVLGGQPAAEHGAPGQVRERVPAVLVGIPSRCDQGCALADLRHCLVQHGEQGALESSVLLVGEPHDLPGDMPMPS